MDGMGMGLGMGFTWLVWVLLIGLIVWGFRAVMNSQASDGTVKSNGNKALEILKERLARGEIDNREFEDKHRRLLD